MDGRMIDRRKSWEFGPSLSRSPNMETARQIHHFCQFSSAAVGTSTRANTHSHTLMLEIDHAPRGRRSTRASKQLQLA